MQEQRPHYTLVFPAYNEEFRIRSTLELYHAEWARALQGTDRTFEFVVVANGCTDNTNGAVQHVACDLNAMAEVRLLSIPQANKGTAVLQGFRAARGTDVIGFTDADGAIDPATMLGIMREAEKGNVAIGSKYLDDTQCRRAQPFVRCVASRGWNLLVRGVLGLQVKDTQAGAKALPAECARKIVDRVLPCNFAFDVSLLWEAKLAGYSIVEKSITWEHAAGSKFRLTCEVLPMFWALLLVRFGGGRRQQSAAGAVEVEMLPSRALAEQR